MITEAPTAVTPLITPSVSRRIWYWPTNEEAEQSVFNISGSHRRCISRMQPFDAGVLYVWSPTMVNLDITDHQGNHFPKTSVSIAAIETPGCAQWMDYQLKAAAGRS